MAAGRIVFHVFIVMSFGLLPEAARADCAKLQNLAAERAEALHIARKNIKLITRQIADTTDDGLIETLESDRRLLREQHAAIVRKIEANGLRLIEECGDGE